MSVILSKSLTHENQSLELMVKYDPATNTVDEVKSIWLIYHGKQIPVGNLMMKFFEPAVNKIIDETDWREVYRAMGEDEGDRDKGVHPVFAEIFEAHGIDCNSNG